MRERESTVNDEPGRRDSELTPRDSELAQRLARTLDASVDAFDAQTREQLVLIRHRALMRSRRQRVAGAVALAASILALIATPWMLHQRAHDHVAVDNAYLSVDPEMLADMDMLQAIGEPQ